MPTYPFKLTMLSRVHIGTGEELEPTEYIVKKETGNGEDNYVVDVIDLPAFVASLSPEDRRKFDEAVAKDALFYLRKFIARHPAAVRFRRYWCAASEDFFNRYQRALDGDAAQLLVNTMARTGVGSRSYIPGSSLKGSLRTAVVSALAMARKDASALQAIARNPRDHRDFEPEVLGYRDDHGRREIRADPFRAVKVSDATLSGPNTAIAATQIFAPGRPAGSPDPGGIQMFHEMTFSLLDGVTVEAAGTISIDDRLAKREARGDGRWAFPHCVGGGITVAQILEDCRSFYGARLRKEHENFYRRHGEMDEIGRQLLGLLEAMKDNEALVRLGRFSHFECVTVERFAVQPRRGAGKTRTVAEGCLPMGWAKLAIEGV